MSENPALKPCPFCGTLPTLNDDTFQYNPEIDNAVIDEHCIFCPNEACGPAPCVVGGSIPDLIALWNKRAPIDEYFQTITVSHPDFAKGPYIGWKGNL